MDAHHHGNLPGLAAPKLAHQPAVDLAPLGAAAPPHVGVSPTSDNAPWQARVEGNEKTDDHDCAANERRRKEAATVTARAALLGLELQPVSDGQWRLSAGPKATDYASLQAAAGVVFGVELVRRDLAAMLGRMGSRHE